MTTIAQQDLIQSVAVDAKGESVHETGPCAWRQRIAGVPVTIA